MNMSKFKKINKIWTKKYVHLFSCPGNISKTAHNSVWKYVVLTINSIIIGIPCAKMVLIYETNMSTY